MPHAKLTHSLASQVERRKNDAFGVPPVDKSLPIAQTLEQQIQDTVEAADKVKKFLNASGLLELPEWFGADTTYQVGGYPRVKGADLYSQMSLAVATGRWHWQLVVGRCHWQLAVRIGSWHFLWHCDAFRWILEDFGRSPWTPVGSFFRMSVLFDAFQWFLQVILAI